MKFSTRWKRSEPLSMNPTGNDPKPKPGAIDGTRPEAARAGQPQPSDPVEVLHDELVQEWLQAVYPRRRRVARSQGARGSQARIGSRLRAAVRSSFPNLRPGGLWKAFVRLISFGARPQ